MKPLTLPTGTWLFVKVPKDATRMTVTNHQDGLIYYVNYKPIQIDFEPKTKWQIFSLASEVTEELAAQIVKVDFLYCEITGSTIYPQFDKKDTFCDTATESFATLMAAHGMYLKNPLGPKLSINWSSEKVARRQARMIDEWQSHESNVGEYLILRQVK